MRIVFELEEEDVKRLEATLNSGSARAGGVDEIDVIDAVRHALRAFPASKAPRFVRMRLAKVERLIEMLEDEIWALPAAERDLVVRTLIYLADPEDLIADELPVFGMLDDAIMLEMLLVRLHEVLAAYDDFCHYRKARGVLPEAPQARSEEVQRWVLRRKRLHQRMRLRQQRQPA